MEEEKKREENKVFVSKKEVYNWEMSQKITENHKMGNFRQNRGY